MDNDLPSTLSGQFWLQPAIHYQEPPLSYLNTATLVTSTLPVRPLLENFIIGEVSTNQKPSTSVKVDPKRAREFITYALNTLPALKIIFERSQPDGSPPFCDFHEWASVSDNVSDVAF